MFVSLSNTQKEICPIRCLASRGTAPEAANRGQSPPAQTAPESGTECQQKPGSTASSHTMAMRSPRSGPTSPCLQDQETKGIWTLPSQVPFISPKPKGKERKAQAVTCMSLKQKPLSRRLGTNSSTAPCITSVAAVQSLSHARFFCNPKDCSSSAHEISQARILEWVAIPYSRESS